jgi:hypothetical protein
MSWLGQDQEIFFDTVMVVDRQGLHRQTPGFPRGNALADVNRKIPHMRLAKLRFRLKHLTEGGLIQPRELHCGCSSPTHFYPKSIRFPKLGL